MAALDDAQAALLRCRQHLAAAQRITRCGSWELELGDLSDIDANPLRWSDEVFRIFGYEPGEIAVTNENFFRAVHPDDRARIGAAVRDAIIMTGGPCTAEAQRFLETSGVRSIEKPFRLDELHRAIGAVTRRGS